MSKLHTKKITGVILSMVLLFVFCICGCKKVEVDEPVTKDVVNTSSILVAEGFMQSIFTDDSELFYSCFPENVFTEDEHAFEFYRMNIPDNGEYIGIKYQMYNKILAEDGYDPEYIRTSISLVHSVPEENITDMQIVKLEVCFELNDKEYNSVNVFIVVYQNSEDGNWYAFEMQNSDSELS